jgi:asparagine synthase (glutamine-hydrolysing)
MSGIFGVVSCDGGVVAGDALDPMMPAMSVWATDGRRTATAAGAAFGHAALHVVPHAESERQPFTHPQWPDLMITADAWLDDREALWEALGIEHEQRGAMGDAELILRAYERWGAACVGRLYGDFAFAIWDASRRELFCATDFLAKRPLLYAIDAHTVRFASDINALLAALPAAPRMNEVYIAAGLQFDVAWASLRHTYFEGVMSLPPGHMLTVNARGARLERWWSPQSVAAQPAASDVEYVERGRSLVQRAVQDCMRTERRVGAHLSGGLDSSSVAMLAGWTARERGDRLPTYTWLPPPPADGALPVDHDRILQVCALAGATVRYVDPESIDVDEWKRRDPARLPTTMLRHEPIVQQQAQQDGVRVMLSGWGGDEIISFNGRGYIMGLVARGRFGQVHRDLSTLARARGEGVIGRLLVYQKMLRTRVLTPSWQAFVAPRFAVASAPPDVGARPEFLRRYADAVGALRGVQLVGAEIGVRRSQSALIEHGHLTQRIASWATAGAAHGMFYRYPLLDRRVVEFCLGLPEHLHFGDGGTRPFYSRVAEPFLPPGFRAMAPKFEPSLASRKRTKREKIDAFENSARDVAAINSHPAVRYVDPERLIQAIRRNAVARRTAVNSRTLGFANSLFQIDMPG